MTKRFPITQQQFRDWLDEKPRAKAGTWDRCPIDTACLDIMGVDDAISDAGSLPKWVDEAAYKIDDVVGSSWTLTRGAIRKLLD